MKINILPLDQCAQARGVVVAVDVVRAFTTAAFAFAAGAERILLVSTAEEALDLKQSLPGSLIMGEVRGERVKGFDFWNSPTELARQDLTGRTMIQRTSAGTQGVVCVPSAEVLLASSLVVASATARLLRRLRPIEITFIATGAQSASGGGLEDIACCQVITALLEGKPVDEARYQGQLARVEELWRGRLDPEAPAILSDLQYCFDLDRFDFGLVIQAQDGLFEMRPERFL